MEPFSHTRLLRVVWLLLAGMLLLLSACADLTDLPGFTTAPPLPSPTATAAPAATPTEEPVAVAEVTTLTYESTAGEFTIDYPSTAQIYEEQRPSVDGTLAAAKNTVAIQPAEQNFVLTVTYFDLDPGADLATFVSEQSGCVEVVPESGEPATLNGLRALFFADTACGPAGTSYYFLVRSGRGYRFEVESNAPYANIAPSVQPLLESFTVTAVPSPPSVLLPVPADGVPAPAGLVLRNEEGLWQVDAAGDLQPLTPYGAAQLSPDGRYAARLDGESQLWILNLATGSESRRTLLDAQPLGYFSWIDNERLLLGVWTGNEDSGPNAGHPAVYHVTTGTLLVLDDDHLMSAPPTAAPDGQTVAYNTFDGAALYREESGVTLLDLPGFAGFPGVQGLAVGPVAWSPDGRRLAWRMSGPFGADGALQSATVLLDLEAMTATIFYPHEAADGGGWPPAPVWSPDGQWLAQIVEAADEAESGLYLLAADGSEALRIGAAARANPVWLPDGRQLLFTEAASGQPSTVMRYDLDTAATEPVALPPGNTAVTLLPVPESAETPEAATPEAETAAPDVSLEDLQPETAVTTSPDGRWQAEVTVALPIIDGRTVSDRYYQQLRVTRTDGSIEWTPIERWSNYGLGYTVPQPLYWSEDGQYLYFTNRPVVDGCGVFINASDLVRLDLSSGNLVEIVPPVASSLAISPDGAYVAYFGQGEDRLRLTLRELATGVERWVIVNGTAANVSAGNIVWAPDGSELLLTLAYDACQPETWTHSTLLLDVASLRYETLIEQDARRFVVEQWLNAQDALLRGSAEERPWRLNTVTGNLVQASDQ